MAVVRVIYKKTGEIVDEIYVPVGSDDPDFWPLVNNELLELLTTYRADLLPPSAMSTNNPRSFMNAVIEAIHKYFDFEIIEE